METTCNPVLKLVEGSALEIESWMNLNFGIYVWQAVNVVVVGERTRYWIVAERKDEFEKAMGRAQLLQPGPPRGGFGGRH